MDFLLYAPENPGNLGSIIRTSASFGIDRLFVFDEHSLLEGKNLERVKAVSCGHHDDVVVESVSEPVSFVKSYDDKFVAMISRLRSKQLHEVSFPKDGIVTFGNESKGVPRKINRIYGTKRVMIPTKGHNYCLGLPVAYSLFLYEYLAQHTEGFPSVKW